MAGLTEFEFGDWVTPADAPGSVMAIFVCDGSRSGWKSIYGLIFYHPAPKFHGRVMSLSRSSWKKVDKWVPDPRPR